MKISSLFKILALLLILGMMSCRKIIAIDSPVNQLTADKIYTDSASTTAVLVNVYALFNQSISGTFTPQLGIYTDELSYTGIDAATTELSQSSISVTNTADLTIWKNYYTAIYDCNDIIEGLSNYNGIKPATKSEFIAEAKFLRAYSYFYLTNVYGDVPLILQTDVNTSSVAAQTDTASIYNQIIQDLTDAQNGLALTYTGTGKVRANSLAATALLARTYLYLRRYTDAEQAATTVINSGLYTPLQAPSTVFLAGSKESILQFYTQTGFTGEGAIFVPSSGKPTYLLTPSLLNTFEAGDLRKSAWINTSTVTSAGVTTIYYYPYKYHNRLANTGTAEYLMGLRVSEQYLIRAEARLQQNNLAGAVSDLNIIRQRAGLTPVLNNISVSSCMDAIVHERQVELFAEWGNRFFDLKRTGRINSVMDSYKTTWKPAANLFPIPQNERTADPNLGQNPGY